MKLLSIQPPYPGNLGECETAFAFILDKLRTCNATNGIILTPEYSNAAGPLPAAEFANFALAHAESLHAAACEAAVRNHAIVILSYARPTGDGCKCGRWNIAEDKNLPHSDYLEMSGLQVSLIVDYGVNEDGGLLLKRHVVWPQMRTIPNNTHASFQVDICYSARLANEPHEALYGASELLRRRARLAEITAPMILETGIPEIDAEFHMAKIRAGESIFKTRTGLMHSPGGRGFYAATWCNDQVEYAGPWFAFTADKLACEASLNAYRHYMPFMGPDYKAIPSSVIAEGLDIWEGRGDRGDAAMYAYGASRFALALGDRDIALELWPAIEWTLEYCRRNLKSEG